MTIGTQSTLNQPVPKPSTGVVAAKTDVTTPPDPPEPRETPTAGSGIWETSHSHSAETLNEDLAERQDTRRDHSRAGDHPEVIHSSDRAIAKGNNLNSTDHRPPGWDGPNDPENPRNWSLGRKWSAVAVVSAYTFITPVASSMVAPALPYLDEDLGITSSFVSQLTLSIFILAYAFGPLFLGPLSELYGRVIVLQTANLFFLVFNLVCGFAQTTAQLIIFRFLAGLGGSAPMAVGGGVLGDCFANEQRGLAVALYSLGPIMGPAIGPVAGGFIAGNISWRWCFYIVSICDAAIQIVGLRFLQETYPPILLARRRASHAHPSAKTQLRFVSSDSDTPLVKRLETSLIRPLKMLGTQPTVMVFSLYQAFIYGLNYLVISTFTSLWTDIYDQSAGISGLHYIALAIGYTVGAQSTSRFNDWNYRRLKAKNKGVGLPEFRMIVLVPATILIPIGLFWYGWSAQAKTFWLMPDIGIGIFAAGMISGSQAVQTYLIDTYPRYAASAISAMNSLRSLAGFGFPLFAPSMYHTLGYGWGNSLLAFVALFIGMPAPYIFCRYGAELRRRSLYSAGE